MKKNISRNPLWPDWYNGKKIDEVQFGRAFLEQWPLKCVNGTLYTLDGPVEDESEIKQRILENIEEYVTSGLSKKVTNILETIKLLAFSDPFPIEQDCIHLQNGVYHLPDGSFQESRLFCQNRLPVRYDPKAASPDRWLTFLHELLDDADIPTLQEYLGYCLIPSTKGQKMMLIVGKGGEGKSRIGLVLKRLMGDAASNGSVQKVENNRFARADLECRLLMIDDDMDMKGGIDTAQFGRYVAQQEQGAFTEYGYLVKSGDVWQKVHEGQPVPEEYRVLSFPAPEVLRDSANISPPIQSEPQLQKVLPIILNGKDSAERMKEITDRLETGIQQLFDSDRYKAYLTTMAKFHNYSFNNTLLIAMQGGQLVAGFNKWKGTFHRTVKKGEKGIKILAPAPYKVKQKMEKLDEQGKRILDKDGKPLTEEKTVQIPAFKVVSVFDVSQTEGEPLPSIAVNELSGSVQDYQDFFKALEQSSPVPIGFEGIEGGAHGYFHLLDNRIAIQEGMSQLQTIKTAIHEIAHAKLHAIDPNDPEQINCPDSRTREVQAESVAYAVCQHYGLDTSEYSFGYVAGWSSGRELAELKASLEIIRNTAHELISALDEHLAELRQQRETELSTAQEAAFALDNGNTLFIQTCDSGYDYTLYGPDNKALDGGQLDAPGLTLPDAGEEALALLGQTVKVSEVLLGDKLAAFQEAAEKANEIPAPVKIPDPAAEPTVTILWSESDKLQDGETMPLSVANRVFEELDTTQHTEREKDGYTGGWYDKTAFRIDFTLNGQPDNYEGRQDFGDGEGSLVQHIQNYHEYYAKDENWKNFVLHNKGPKAWEQDKAEREMVLTEFIPYLKQHCNLSAISSKEISFA